MDERRTIDRRQRRAGFRVPERRTGFERRYGADSLLELRDRPSQLFGLLLALNALSVGDWMLTTRALEHGAVEANLVLASVMSQSWTLALAFKLSMVLLGSVAIWMARRYRLVLGTAVLVSTVYLAVALYQAGELALIRAL
jgi:hypothetical protein